MSDFKKHIWNKDPCISYDPVKTSMSWMLQETGKDTVMISPCDNPSSYIGWFDNPSATLLEQLETIVAQHNISIAQLRERVEQAFDKIHE